MRESDSVEIMEWFERREGRPAGSTSEAVAKALAVSHEINPRLRKRDELFKAYVSSKGGQTLEYAKLWQPLVWGEWRLNRTNADIVIRLGVSEEDGLVVMEDILRNVNRALKQTAEYRSQPTAEYFHDVDLSQ